MTLLKVDIFMKKWFFSNDPTHDDYANQTHINSNLSNRNDMAKKQAQDL